MFEFIYNAFWVDRSNTHHFLLIWVLVVLTLYLTYLILHQYTNHIQSEQNVYAAASVMGWTFSPVFVVFFFQNLLLNNSPGLVVPFLILSCLIMFVYSLGQCLGKADNTAVSSFLTVLVCFEIVFGLYVLLPVEYKGNPVRIGQSGGSTKRR